MTTSTSDFLRADVRDSNFDRNRTSRPRRRAARLALSWLALASFLCSSVGCEAIKNHKCCLFSSTGSEVERLPSRDEKDVVARAASASASERRGAWEPTESELQAARSAGVDLKNYVWAAQRPNGGVLFPKELPGYGPLVLLEPKSITAPVGSEIILVASYVGEDSEYMRVGEKLNWTLSGVGMFTQTNPNDSRFLVARPWAKTTRDVDSRSMETETSGQLYRINRGTDTPLDDVTILRGQSWTSVSSYEEGVSSVVVLSDTIPNWEQRRANAEIHWIDAAFLMPKSGVHPVDRPDLLTTSVCRRSTSEPRSGWPVRYEILSGNSTLGDSGAKSLTVQTDAAGNATVKIVPSIGTPGTSQIAVSVIRPGSENTKEVVVEKETISYTWTTTAPVTLQLLGPESSAVGENMPYKIVVNNFSDFPYDASVEMTLPPDTTFVGSDPQPTNVLSAEGKFVWVFNNLPEQGNTSINLTLHKDSAGPVRMQSRLFNLKPTGPTTNSSAPSSTPDASVQPSLGVQPPVESP